MIDVADWIGRVWEGDCTEFIRALPDGCVDLIMLDPPYGEGQAEWDAEMPSGQLWDESARLLADGGSLYYWGFWGHAPTIIGEAQRVDLIPLSELVWWFRTGRPQAKNYRQDTERCWFFAKGEPRVFNADAAREAYVKPGNEKRYHTPKKHPGTVWIASRVLWNHPGNVGHPTQKPESLIGKIVAVSSNPGDLVLDPFLGSGTTAVVCERLGRRWIGCEINPEYVKMAEKRIAREREKLQLPFEE